MIESILYFLPTRLCDIIADYYRPPNKFHLNNLYWHHSHLFHANGQNTVSVHNTGELAFNNAEIMNSYELRLTLAGYDIRADQINFYSLYLTDSFILAIISLSYKDSPLADRCLMKLDHTGKVINVSAVHASQIIHHDEETIYARDGGHILILTHDLEMDDLIIPKYKEHDVIKHICHDNGTYIMTIQHGDDVRIVRYDGTGKETKLGFDASKYKSPSKVMTAAGRTYICYQMSYIDLVDVLVIIDPMCGIHTISSDDLRIGDVNVINDEITFTAKNNGSCAVYRL